MNRFILIFNFFIFILLISTGCSSYEKIHITSKINGTSANYSKTNDRLTITKKKYYKKITKIETSRYLLRLGGWSPLSHIIDRAVDEILKGNLDEAKTILLASKIHDNKGIISNNLAIIYELIDRKRLAFSSYYNAILISPDNEFFKKNFLYFTNCPGRVTSR